MSAGTAVSEFTSRPAARGAAHARTRPGALWVAVAALTIAGAALRFYRLGHQGFWFDEGNTALLVHMSPGKMLGLIPQSESTPPLYYCLAWVWVRIFGFGEVGLRSLSALAGVLVVPVAYGAARNLVSPRAGLIAAALAAFSPLLIWYSQEARSYELLILFGGLSLLTFASLLDRPASRSTAAWVIASALALATHYYATLLVVPEAVWLLVVHRRRRPVQAGIALVALCGLALIPLALSQNGAGNANWIARTPLGHRVKEILPQFVIGFGSPSYRVFEPLALALGLLGLVLLATRSECRQRQGALVAGGLAVTGLVLMLLLGAAGIDNLLTRNLLAVWMAAAVALAGGFAAPRARALGAVAAGALCVTGIVAALGTALDRKLQRPDWRPVARALSAPAVGTRTTRRLILIQHYRDLLPLSLYLPRLKFMRGRGAAVSELDVISFTSSRGTLCWWGSACNLSPSQLQASYAIPGFRVVSRTTANQFTVLRMTAPRPVFLTPRVVARSLLRTHFWNDVLLIQR